MRKKAVALALITVMTVSSGACAHEHVFGDWQVKEEATCTEKGLEERKCEKCEETETREIAALGHNFAEATYFAPERCRVCGETRGEPLATVVSVGEPVKTDKYEFTVSNLFDYDDLVDIMPDDWLQSVEPNSYGILLSYTNLGKEEFNQYFSKHKDEFAALILCDNQYEYKADYYMAYSGEEIPPLVTDYLFIIGDVPDEVYNDSFKELGLVFTFYGDTYSIGLREASDGYINYDDTQYANDKDRLY